MKYILNIPLVTVTVMFIVFLKSTQSALTVHQMEDAAKTLRGICQPKFNLTDDLVNDVKMGKFPENHDLKCYVNCVLEFLQIMKKGKFDYDTTIQHSVFLPEEIRSDYKKAIDACHHMGDNVTDSCEAAYVILQCFEKESTQFIFP